MRGLATLTPAESKRLIGRAVAMLPEVQLAFARGRVIIAGGTTNAFVCEELTGRKLDKALYTAGIVTDGHTCVTPASERLSPVTLVDGQPVEEVWQDVLKGFTSQDVFIKGANAVDPTGMVGVLVAAPNGGTIGTAFGPVLAVGAHLIVPVGLEKLVTDVAGASRAMGFGRMERSIGLACGLIPVSGATVVTELVALKVLFGVDSVHVASGGVGGSEGTVVLALEGTDEGMARAMDYLESVKGEAPVGLAKSDCNTCQMRCNRAATRN